MSNYKLTIRSCGYDIELDYNRKHDDIEVHAVDGLDVTQEFLEEVLPTIWDKLTIACFKAANEEDRKKMEEHKEWQNFTYTHTYL